MSEERTTSGGQAVNIRGLYIRDPKRSKFGAQVINADQQNINPWGNCFGLTSLTIRLATKQAPEAKKTKAATKHWNERTGQHMGSIFKGSKKTFYVSMITSGPWLGIRFAVFLCIRPNTKALTGSNPLGNLELQSFQLQFGLFYRDATRFTLRFQP